jgi:hypothetical protein
MVVRRWPKVKIIVTSEVALTEIGDEDFGTRIRLLAKPYRKDDLARTLREVLDSGNLDSGNSDGAARRGA